MGGDLVVAASGGVDAVDQVGGAEGPRITAAPGQVGLTDIT
ncbi:hypothetical protein ACQP1S_30610 [Micromonospora matsumotoense]